MPVPLQAGLAAAVVALGIGVLWVASGAFGPFVSGVVSGFGGLVDTVGAAVGSAPPTQAPPTSDAPSIVSPAEPYTNDDAVDITVNVPADVVGDADSTLRLYVAVGDADPTLVVEQPIGRTSVQVVPGVALSKGRNAFQAAINGPGGESERSAIATWVLDNSKPKLTIISPADGSSTSKDAVTIKGKTQAGSSVRVKNDDNGATVNVDANKDGLFEARIRIGAGLNAIRITTIDPAGNPNDASLTIRKGSGKTTAKLTATQLPVPHQGAAQVGDVHGPGHRPGRRAGRPTASRCSRCRCPASRRSCPARSRPTTTARPGSPRASPRARWPAPAWPRSWWTRASSAPSPTGRC